MIFLWNYIPLRMWNWICVRALALKLRAHRGAGMISEIYSPSLDGGEDRKRKKSNLKGFCILNWCAKSTPGNWWACHSDCRHGVSCPSCLPPWHYGKLGEFKCESQDVSFYWDLFSWVVQFAILLTYCLENIGLNASILGAKQGKIKFSMYVLTFIPLCSV